MPSTDRLILSIVFRLRVEGNQIGLFLMAGAFSIYVMSRNNNRQLQIYNEMQENGRIAMNLLQNDLRMTGFFGDLTG